MSSVIYARVPDSLRSATDLYAADNGLSLTRAVVDLLERGLVAASGERSVAALEANLARATNENAQLDADLQTTRAELGAVQAFAQRAGQTIGTCPKAGCGQPITGYDLLAIGRCASCGQSLSGLLAPGTSTSTLDQREFMMLVGALGALLAIAFLASKGK
jgi:hypothetical protein